MTANSFILGATRYRVVAPVVIVRLIGAGKAAALHVWRGETLPANASHSHVRDLLEMGMIRPVEGARA